MNRSGAAQHGGSVELIAALAPEDRAQRELPIEVGLELMHGEPAAQADRVIRVEIEGPLRCFPEIFRKTRKGIRMGLGDVQAALEPVLQRRRQLLH